MHRIVVVLAFAAACSGGKDTDRFPTDNVTYYTDTDTDDTDDPGGDDFDGDGFSVADGDCDDNNLFVYPGAEDTPYDGVDSDCAGDNDFDVDADGYDSADYGGDDCDDLDAAANPGQTEVDGDGIDNDCDGCGGVDEITVPWYDDFDLDGFGDAEAVTAACAQPPGTVATGDDCNDDDPEIYPGQAEVCDGIDQDCNDLIDDTLPELAWYPDLDGDTFGDAATAPAIVCNGTQPPGWITDGQDCNDADPDTYPGAPTIACDGSDNDCDGLTIEAPGVRLDGVAVTTIDQALSAALPGSLVEVCEGAYTVSGLEISVPLELRGLGGSALTTLDGGGTPLLEVTTIQPVTIAGFLLTGGTGFPNIEHGTSGGGLRLNIGSTVSVDDVVITGNTAGGGGGIGGGSNVDLTMSNSFVTFNEGDDAATPVPAGAGIQLGDGAVLTLTDVEITDNLAGSCGGLDLAEASSTVGAGTVLIARNDTLLAGAGGCIGDGGFLSGVEVAENTTGNAVAGMRLVGTQVVDSTFRDNVAGLTGGGASGEGILLFERVTFDNNTAFDGGAFDLTFDTTRATLVDCVVTNNEATFFAADGGGALLSLGAQMESVNTEWNFNIPQDVALNSSGNAYTYAGVADFFCSDDADSCL